MVAATLSFLFSGIDLFKECQLQDDGAGPYIAQWNRPEPQPTQAEIEAAYPAALAAAQRAAIPAVTRRKMLTALHRLTLLQRVKDWVALQDIEVQIAFDEAQDFERDNVLIEGARVAFAMTHAEVDAIFALAASIA